MNLTRIGVLSAGKMLGALYALLGLLIGGIFTLMALAGMSVSPEEGGVGTFAVGVGSIILFPLMYGIMGFIGGLILAALFNVVASLVGGLEVEFTSHQYPSYPPPQPPAQA
jgi:hypothetical protein